MNKKTKQIILSAVTFSVAFSALNPIQSIAEAKPTMRERVAAILGSNPWSSFYKPEFQKEGANTEKDIEVLPDTDAVNSSDVDISNDNNEIDETIKRSEELRRQLALVVEKRKKENTTRKFGVEQQQKKDYRSINDYEEPIIIEDETLAISEPIKAQDDCLYFEYHPGTINRVMATPGFLTDIRLQPGEMIERITMGDRSRWEVHTYYDDIQRTCHIYLQPIQEGIESNIIIATDKHNYQLHLISSSINNPIVAWNYPNESSLFQDSKPTNVILEVTSPDKLNFNYNISRKNNYNWSPRYVFDDGFNTYLTIDPDVFNSVNPAIFTINRIGNMVLVDYEKINGNIVIHDVLDNLQVNVGDKMIKIQKV